MAGVASTVQRCESRLPDVPPRAAPSQERDSELFVVPTTAFVPNVYAAEPTAATSHPQITELPAATDLLELVIQQIAAAAFDSHLAWTALLRLRRVSHLIGTIATRQLRDVGVPCGPCEQHSFGARGAIHFIATTFGAVEWDLRVAARRIGVSTSQGYYSGQREDVTTLTQDERLGYWTPSIHETTKGLADLDRWMDFDEGLRTVDHPPALNHPPVFVLQRDGPCCVALDEPSGALGHWLAVDLGPRARLILSDVALRHSSRQGCALRSFRIDGRNMPLAPERGSRNPNRLAEDSEWTPLLHVDDDPRLGTAEHSSASWSVPRTSSASPPAPPQAFRCFRVVKTGPDARGEAHLHLSGIELFGMLCMRLDDPAAAADGVRGVWRSAWPPVLAPGSLTDADF